MTPDPGDELTEADLVSMLILDVGYTLDEIGELTDEVIGNLIRFAVRRKREMEQRDRGGRSMPLASLTKTDWLANARQMGMSDEAIREWWEKDYQQDHGELEW